MPKPHFKKSFDNAAPRPFKPRAVEEPEAYAPVPYSEFALSEPVARAIGEMGFETATAIQAKAIPVLMEGRDMLAQAQTGTGKTAAFGLPMIERLDPSDRSTQAIVLAPTRELAVQVAEAIAAMAKPHGPFGRAGVRRPAHRPAAQARSSSGAQIVVGTPGPRARPPQP